MDPTETPEAALEPTTAPKRGPGRPPKAASQTAPDGIAMRVLRDYWTDDGTRVCAGTIEHLDAMAALLGIESGIMERVRE